MSSRRSIGNTFHVTTITDGTNGTNAFSVDLSNEMDSVACDSDMKTAVAFNIYSQIAAFYGVKDVTALCQIRYTSKPTNASLTLETSGSGTGGTSLTTTFQTISTKQWIRIHYNSGVAVSKRETLEVEIKHATYGTIALSIAVVGMKGGAIYNLVPSANAITHKKDGTYTPNVITCGSSKLDVATGTTSSNPYEATIKYSADGGSVTNYPSGGLTAGTNFTNYVTFFLYVNNTVVDKETVNIVTDGKYGKDGAEGKGYKLFLKRDNSYTDVQWDTWGAIGFNDSYSKVTGDPDFTLCRVGDLFVVSGKSSDSGKNHTTTLKCSGVNVGVTPNVIYGTVVAHEHDGDDGQRGKAGRFYYFAGDWNSSTTYVMTDTQAPYVKASNGSFYMLDNAGNGGSNVNSTNQNPTNSSYGNGKPWSVMQSDHQYYIAKAFFGNYAQFGSAIINGDWMISTYGKKNGSTSNDYTSFDPSDPTGVSSSSHFAPNFCVDLKYGVCYMQDAYVKGWIVAESGAIGGFNINSDKLTNTNYDASVSIQDAYGNQVSRIGKEAKDAMTNQSCSLEAQSRGTGTYNTALYLDASGATYNYAFHGNGNGVLNGLVFGFKTKVYTVSGSGDTTQQLILTDGATFVLKGSKTSGWANFNVPTLDNVKLSLGLKTSDTVPFAIEINFINHSSYDNVKLLFYNSRRTSLPKWYNYNFNGTADEMQLAKGDFAKFLLTFDGYNYRANRIIHHEDGWG